MMTGAAEQAAEQVAEQAADIERAAAGRTLLDALDEAASGHGDTAALKWRSGSTWQSLGWREVRDQAGLAALGLGELGVGPGELVGILMSNRPELVIADLALLHLRAVPVCLFDSFTDEQLATVLRTLGIRTVIAEGEAGLRRLGGAARAVLMTGDVPGTTPWQALMAAGRARAALGDGRLEELRRAVHPDDLVSVNYTSGTTGGLKGVRHTHKNVLWHAESFARFMPVPPGTRFLSYLSRAHATERFVSTWYPLTRAATIHLCPGPLQLGEYLAEVRPQFFGGVQRVWEKLYAARVPPPGLDEVGFAFSGGGALAGSVLEFFHSAGVPLAEGWGQSELVSAAACGRAGELRIGAAGRPLPGVAIRVAADGELLVRSGSQMLGYAGPTAMADPAGADGWLHTGDLGRIDTDGYVHVDGRRQEVFRLAGGHLVSATRVESQLRANLLVDDACVVGA